MRHSDLSQSDKLAVVLFCVASALALALFLIEKTPTTIVVLCGGIAVFMAYPIYHIFGRGWIRAAASLVLLVCIGILGWAIWPKVSSTHISQSPQSQSVALSAANPPEQMSQQHPVQISNATSQPQEGNASPKLALQQIDKRPVSIVAPASESPAGSTAPVQPIVSAPLGVAIGGNNYGNPTVNNYAPPPPRVGIISEQPIPAIAPFSIPPGQDRMAAAIHYNGLLGQEKSYLYSNGNPDGGMPAGIRVTFSVDSSFVNPKFMWRCDHPCVATSVMTGVTDGSNTSETNGLPSVLLPGQFVVMTFREDGGGPITRVEVAPEDPTIEIKRR